ncbi:UNVERIFIED_CONTAM: hypothetical protein FKN15_057167 [Acipenser sinensis]
MTRLPARKRAQDEQASPGGDEQASPGGDEQASPGSGEQASPGGGEQASPGGGEQASPGGDEQASPGGDEQASPGSGEQASPGGDEQASPGGDVQASPGGEEQASPGGDELASPGGDVQASPGDGDLASPGLQRTLRSSPSVAGDWYSSPSVAGDLGFPFLASGHVGFPPPTWAMETAKLGTPDVAVSLAVALLPSALDSPAVALLFWEGAVEWEMPFNPLPADYGDWCSSPSVAGDWYSSPSVAGDLASGHVGFPPPTWAMETAKLGTPDVAVSLAVALLPSALDSPAVALLFWEGAVEWEMPFNPLPADGAPTSDLYSEEESAPAALPFFLLQLVLAAPGDSRVSPSFSPGPAVVPLPGVGDGSPRQWQSTTPL